MSTLRYAVEILGWFTLITCAWGVLIILCCCMVKRKAHECNRCRRVFLTIDRDDFLCPACHAAEEFHPEKN